MQDPVKQGKAIIVLAVLLGAGYGLVLFILSIIQTAVGGVETVAGNAIGQFMTAYTSPEVITIVGAVILLMFLSLAAPSIANLIEAFSGIGGKKGKKGSYE
jgi:hypothetical protein